MKEDVVLLEIRNALESSEDRDSKARRIAELIRSFGPYRWVGIYDVGEQDISAIAWSGPGPPACPSFPRTAGLSGAAVASRHPVISNDVAADPRYLTALSGTQSEIIVPVLSPHDQSVIGTIDVESDQKNAFTSADRMALEECARVAAQLWE